MSKITLSTPSVGEHVVGGIRFVDGKAESVLGPHSRRFFEALGATVTDGKARAKPAARKRPAKKVGKASKLTAPAAPEHTPPAE